MNIKKRAMTGVAWNSSGRVAREVVQLVSMLIIARFLQPIELGIYAIVLVFVNLMSIIGAAGSSQILIMEDTLTSRLTTSLFYLNFLIGGFLFLVLFLTSDLIAIFFAQPDLKLLLQVISITFLLQAPILIQRALLEKALAFRKLVLIEMAAVLTSSTISIVAAMAGYGVSSLLFLSLSNTAVLAITLWFCSDWRPIERPHFAELQSIGHHAFNLTGSAVLNFFTRSADVFLIGRFVGSTQLGLYTLAYRLTLYPVQAISQVVHRVLFPVLSQLGGNPAVLRDTYLKSLEGIALLIFPMTVCGVVVAKSFVSLFLGEQWLPIVQLIYIFAPLCIIQSVVATVGTVYTAKGQTGLMLRMGILNSGVILTSFLVGIQYGLSGVAIAYVVANLVMLYPNLKTCWHLIGVRLDHGIAKLFPYAVCALIMGFAAALAGVLLKSAGFHVALVLIGQIIVALFVYPILLWLFFQESLLRLLAVFYRG